MPPRSGAPPQITFCLEPSRLPTSARAAGAGQRAQQGAYSEERRACKPPPPPFPTRAPPRSESHGACRPHPPRKAVRREPSCFELFSLEPSRSRPPPGRQVPGSERSKAPIRRNDEPANRRRPRFRRERRRAASRTVPAAHPPRTRLLEPSRLPASARAAGAGQRAQQGAYSEERRACKPPPPLFPTRAPPRSESHGACRPSASNTPPRTVRPLFIFHAPPHTAALFHSSRRTAVSPSAGWPRAHPPP